MSQGGANRIRVGIIGANPDRGWAAQAHIPALQSLSDDFEITALSTSRRESADAASKLSTRARPCTANGRSPMAWMRPRP
jgi:predicted dehydrogenase